MTQTHHQAARLAIWVVCCTLRLAAEASADRAAVAGYKQQHRPSGHSALAVIGGFESAGTWRCWLGRRSHPAQRVSSTGQHADTGRDTGSAHRRQPTAHWSANCYARRYTLPHAECEHIGPSLEVDASPLVRQVLLSQTDFWIKACKVSGHFEGLHAWVSSTCAMWAACACACECSADLGRSASVLHPIAGLPRPVGLHLG